MLHPDSSRIGLRVASDLISHHAFHSGILSFLEGAKSISISHWSWGQLKLFSMPRLRAFKGSKDKKTAHIGLSLHHEQCAENNFSNSNPYYMLPPSPSYSLARSS